MLRTLYTKTNAIWMIIFVLLFSGVFLSFDSPIALYPKASKPEDRTGITHPGMSSQQFRALYGEQIELAFMNHKDVDNVEVSYYGEGVMFSLKYKWGIEREDAFTETRKITSAFVGRFPREWGNFWQWSPDLRSSQVSFILFNTSSAGLEWMEEFDKKIIPVLSQIRGVDGVWFNQYNQEKILIEFIPEKLAAYDITLDEVLRVLREKEFDKDLGKWKPTFDQAKNTLFVNSQKGLEDFRQLAVRSEKEVIIRLKDLADVNFKPQRDGEVTRKAGQYSSAITFNINSTANLAAVAYQVKTTLINQVTEKMPYISVSPFLDPTRVINEAIFDVLFAVLLGIFASTIIVFVFLRALSTTLIISLCVPLSLFGGLLVMRLFNIDINLISIGAMAIASGMTVDSAVVILENIFSEFQNSANKDQTKLDIIWQGVKKVRASIIASLLTTVIVFLPIPFTSPITSAILGDLAIVVIAVLSISLIVTLLIIPSLIYFFLNKGWFQWHLPKQNSKNYEQSLVVNVYSRILEKILNSKTNVTILMICTLLIVASGTGLLFFIKKEIIGKSKSNIVRAQLEFFDSSLDQEQKIKKLDEIEQSFAHKLDERIRTYSQTTYQWDESNGFFNFILYDRKDALKFEADLKTWIPSTLEYGVNIYNWNPTSLSVENVPDFAIEALGDNSAEKKENFRLLTQIINSDALDTNGLSKSYRFDPQMDEYLKFHAPDETWRWLAEATQGRFSESSLSNYLSYLFNARRLRSFEHDEKTVEVETRVAEHLVQTNEDIENIPIVINKRPTPLKAFVKLETSEGNNRFLYSNGRERYHIDISLEQSKAGKPLTQKEKEARLTNVLDKNLTRDQWHFAPVGEEVSENILSLIKALAISICLIFLVLIFEFNRFKQVFIVMAAIPFGAAGVGFALYAFNSVLSVYSMLGLILLAGTAVNNSILITDFFNIYSKAEPETSIKSIIIRASKDRIRPILITSITTIVGMLPIALAFGAGGEVLQPLGLAICGGLTISTFLVLFVVPTLLYISHNKTQGV
ncbi:MAG: efflux RND transporter permease subunit [Oligoflexales bacterium]|nr:efflux RND transporter permease subunit [Oligoflexales bacterium]